MVISRRAPQRSSQLVRSAGGWVVLPTLAKFLQDHALFILKLICVGIQSVHQNGVKFKKEFKVFRAHQSVVAGNVRRGRCVVSRANTAQLTIVFPGSQSTPLVGGRPSKHHMLQNVSNAVLTGRFIQRANLVNEAGVNRRSAVVLDDDNVHTVVQREPTRLLIKRQSRACDQRCECTRQAKNQSFHGLPQKRQKSPGL